jgi:membrane protease YdiL (CAAX protease family)
LWLPGVLITYGFINPGDSFIKIINPLKWLAGIGPSLTAVILLLKFEGRAGLQQLFKRVFQLNLGYWYYAVFLLIPLILICAHLLNMLLFDVSFPQTGLLNEPCWIPVLFLVFFILQFGEELGWRGYALDRLQTRWNALFSSLILGGIWTIWHIPMFFSEGFGHYQNNLPFLQFFLTFLLISVIITWFQNNAKGSLLPAFIVHTYINLSGDVLPLFDKDSGDYTAWVITNVLLTLLVIFIIIFWGYKNLQRKSILK